jgi:hypothetical protein
MMMRGHKLKRTKFFAFAHDDPNLFFQYGYTGFQWSSLKLYTCCTNDARVSCKRAKTRSSMPELKEALQGMQVQDQPAVLNHTIGTLYAICRTEGRDWSAPRQDE